MRPINVKLFYLSSFNTFLKQKKQLAPETTGYNFEDEFQLKVYFVLMKR